MNEWMNAAAACSLQIQSLPFDGCICACLAASQFASALTATAAVAKIVSPEQLCQVMLRLWHYTQVCAVVIIGC